MMCLFFWTSVPPLATGLESCRFENGRKVHGQGKHNAYSCSRSDSLVLLFSIRSFAFRHSTLKVGFSAVIRETKLAFPVGKPI